MTTGLLSLHQIRFGRADALLLDGIDLTVAPGEVVGLCGDPGPSRAALLDLITGVRETRSYAGELRVDGKVCRFRSPADAQKNGIARLRNQLSLVPELSVAENVMLGKEPRRFGLVDEARLEADARALLAHYGVTDWLDGAALAGSLSIGQKQVVELIRYLSQGAKLLVLEETSLALSALERERLFQWLRSVAKLGASILFVSQRVDEVFGVCDRVVVLRDGRTAEAHGARGASAEARELLGGRYTIGEEIASGGMATVHIGRARGSFGFAKTIAVKRLYPQLSRDPAFVAMLIDEARLAGRVRHPNVVPVLDVFADAGEMCLVMEYVEGEALSSLLRATRGTPLPAPIAAGIVVAVLHGLEAAHQARNEAGDLLGIVHRDVSPHNILVGIDGVARLIDFGIAKAMGRSSVSREGQLKGKIPYMAPEQLTGKTATALTDLWGAGVVLWESLTGEALFEGETEGVILGRVLDERVPPPSELCNELSPALDAVSLRALSRDPAARFGSAKEMALALERAIKPASAAEIGAWVEQLAGGVLEERRARLKRVEKG